MRVADLWTATLKSLVSTLASVLVVTLALPDAASATDRVLLLTKSSYVEHPVISRRGGRPSHVETVLSGLAASAGFDLISSKDAGWITGDRLSSLDAVIFYTTGDLTQSGSGEGRYGGEGQRYGGDGEGAMPKNGIRDLTEWVRGGGALLGFHSASATFTSPAGAPQTATDKPTPYIELLGGGFAGHGEQFEGTLRVVDSAHPTMAAIPEAWTVMTEWYTFRNLDVENIHVLALLETESEAKNQKHYDIAPYPVIWCSQVGKGRVFYNAMGHREDVWDREVFQEAFVDALNWALGEGEPGAAPNYRDVVTGR